VRCWFARIAVIQFGTAKRASDNLEFEFLTDQNAFCGGLERELLHGVQAFAEDGQWAFDSVNRSPWCAEVMTDVFASSIECEINSKTSE
jgi:hypothetical protein